MLKITKKTKIVCTIGPASDNYEMLVSLIKAGMNIMRINFSHGSYEEHLKKIELARKVEHDLGVVLPIMLDTKGPEIRTHCFKDHSVFIDTGKTVRIAMEEILGDENKFSVTYKNLYNDVNVGDIIKVDDGNLELQVKEKDEKNHEIVTISLNHHTLKDRRGINCPDCHISLPFVSKQDYSDLVWGCQNHVDYVSASFVRNVKDIKELKKILVDHNGSGIKIIAKIENKEAVKNIDEIIDNVDGIMVARGDLGSEVPPEDVPVIQKDIIKKCRITGKPVITATQMLDSMQTHPNPTRAEVSDVANAILESTDCVMLSGESASGEYPVLACKMQEKISAKMENYLDYEKMAKDAYDTSLKNNNDAIANSVANTANLIGAKLIICFSETGSTANRMAKARPVCPVISISNNREACITSMMSFGIYPKFVKRVPQFIEEMEVVALFEARRQNIPSGSQIIITGGTPVGAGKTNFMKIINVKDIGEIEI